MSELRFKKNHSIDGWPIEDKEMGVIINKEDTINQLNAFNAESAYLKKLLQLCVNDMYSPSGKIKKPTARKLMAACQKGAVNFPD